MKFWKTAALGISSILLLIGCATSAATTDCQEKILDVFIDHELTAVVWVDTTCDDVCDRADIFVVDQFGTVSQLGSLPCESATEVVDEYKREVERLKKGQDI